MSTLRLISEVFNKTEVAQTKLSEPQIRHPFEGFQRSVAAEMRRSYARSLRRAQDVEKIWAILRGVGCLAPIAGVGLGSSLGHQALQVGRTGA